MLSHPSSGSSRMGAATATTAGARLRWRLPVGTLLAAPWAAAALLLCATLLLLLLLAGGGVHPDGGQTHVRTEHGAPLPPSAAATAHQYSLQATRDGYAPLQSLQYYPWDVALEPYREMTLTLQTPSPVRVAWTLTDSAGKSLLREETETATTHKLLHTCDAPGTIMLLTVEGTDDDNSGVTVTESFDVVCKYVRRDLYSLTEEDMERFLSAFSTVAKTEYVEGQKKYGEHFTNLHYQAAKHAWNCTSCTPYHGNWAFLTSHEAFIFEIERAMQLVDPAVCMAYWDFALDFEEVTEDEGPATMHGIFTRRVWEIIGTGSKESDWVIAEGPFAYTTIPHKSDPFAEHVAKFSPDWNAYGYITDYGGANPSAYLTRVSNLCGYEGKVIQGKAKHVRNTLETESSLDFSNKLEDNVHAGMHTMGGLHNCVSDFNALEAATNMISKTQWLEIFEIAAEADTFGYELTCPDEWVRYERYDPSVTDTVCAETCAGFLEYFGVSREEVLANDRGWVEKVKAQMDWTASIQFLKQYGMYESFSALYTHAFTTAYNAELNEEVISFPDTTAEENDVGFRELLAYTCISSTGVTPLIAPFISPLDPIFHLVHIFFNRMMEARRIVPEYAKYGLEYVESEGCQGYGYNDPMPFSNFMGDTSGKWYTNKDLFEMFDPASVRLPYIWDDGLDFSKYPEPPQTDDSDDIDDMDDADDYDIAPLIL